jgi:PAS domain-containing protein
MPQRDIEIILARQFVEHLNLPVFIVDPDGNLVYYNEPAGAVLGYSYDDTGPMPVELWSTIFRPMDENGQSLPPEDLPLVKTILYRHPAHRQISIIGLDSVLRQIDITSIPLFDQSGNFLGAMAIFWEVLA